MNKILKWINYPLKKKKFSILFHLYKKIFIFIKYNYPKIIDSVIFDTEKFDKYKLVETNLGKFIVFSDDGGISRQLFINKQYNFTSFQRTIKILGRQNLLIDVGANIGPVCIAAISKKYVKKSIAIEPEINSYKILKKNISLNNFETKIKIFNNAVSNRNENIKIYLKRGNFGASYIKKFKSKANTVKSIRLDKFYKDILKKTLIWIDVQGYEAKVLDGAKKLIKKNIPFVIEFWPYAINRYSDKNLIISGLKKFKYFYDLSDNKKKLPCTNENIEKLFQKYNKKKTTELLLVNF